MDSYQEFLATVLDEHLQERSQAEISSGLQVLFGRAKDAVPAYGHFLRENNVPDELEITNLEDLHHLPMMTKENYIRKYPLTERYLSGLDSPPAAVAFSSGSTGEPTIWPRSFADECGVALRFEQVFKDSFRAHATPTLAVVTFALGNWVGGIYTTVCCRLLAQKGYPITVVTPGNNPQEILRAVTSLSPRFGQTVLLGYPPFLKELIDLGVAQGVSWDKFSVRLVTAGEVFSERWRSLICERAGIADPAFGTASLYGTADSGVLAVETPLTIAIRRWLEDRPEACQGLFGESRLPSLFQFDPLHRFFEVLDGELLLSANSSHPLLRYRIGDHGGIFTNGDMLARLRHLDCNPAVLLDQAGYSHKSTMRPLPFLFLFGRRQLAISYYGANIFPETVRFVLEAPEFSSWVTGKFVMQVVEDVDYNKILHIAVELASSTPACTERQGENEEQREDAGRGLTLANAIRDTLKELNSEFAHYVPAERQLPGITLHNYGDPSYFPVGVKHRYTR